MEIRLGDWDIRDEVLLVNGEIQGDEIIIFDKIAQFKTYKNKGKNLISDFGSALGPWIRSFSFSEFQCKKS